MKNLGKAQELPTVKGKIGGESLTNYRAPPHPSTGKSPYQLCMNIAVRIKRPIIMETTPDTEAMQKDKDSKTKMKACTDQKQQVKPQNLNTWDTTLVK